MTSRERVLKAINHEEPDRLPLDIGSNVQSGIMAHALDRLRRYLGFTTKPVKVYGVFPPELFEELHMPHFTILNKWIHENTSWKTWVHSCGSISRILPYIVKSGFIFNTVHNIQHGTPPENVTTAYDTAYQYGDYPILSLSL